MSKNRKPQDIFRKLINQKTLKMLSGSIYFFYNFLLFHIYNLWFFFDFKYYKCKNTLHSKNRLLTVKRFRSLLMDFLFKIGIRGNPLKVKVLSFQVLSFYCQIISFGLEMKSFLVRRKNNFDVKRKQIL